MLAIGALGVSFLSLIGTIINSVFTAKTYKKNKRIEFIQRRDYLSRRISDLNDRINEFQLISARYGIVVAKDTGLQLRGEQADKNTALIASIERQREGVEEGIKLWDERIGTLHFIHSKLTLETDGPTVEYMIDTVQAASDNLRKAVSGYSAILHILETSNELIKTSLVEADAKIRQINADFDKAVSKLSYHQDGS